MQMESKPLNVNDLLVGGLEASLEEQDWMIAEVAKIRQIADPAWRMEATKALYQECLQKGMALQLLSYLETLRDLNS